jgi:biopolymer transport protein ExbB
MSVTSRRRLLSACIAVGAVLFLASAAMGWQENPTAGSSSNRPDSATAVDANQSFLRWMITASGPIGLVILLMSFYLVALVAWMFFQFRRSVAIPDPLIQEVIDLLGRKQFDKAYGKVANDRSFLARTLAAGVRKLPSGYPVAQRAMELANEDVTMEMEHHTTYLATVGTLGPMIGLVGTVYGMILSFRVIATAGSSPQASQLAAGISTALFATLEGIALSVPAIAFYALFRNRIARLSLEVSIASESLLEQFAPGIRAPHPLVSAASPQRTALPPKE